MTGTLFMSLLTYDAESLPAVTHDGPSSKTLMLSCQGPLRLSCCPCCCIKYVVPLTVCKCELRVVFLSLSLFSHDPHWVLSRNCTRAAVSFWTIYSESVSRLQRALIWINLKRLKQKTLGFCFMDWDRTHETWYSEPISNVSVTRKQCN